MGPLQIDIAHQLRTIRLGIELEVGAETLALAGPSGAGKSTLLRAIAGLLRPDEGRIQLGTCSWFDAGRNIDLSPEERSVGLVFQEYALFPHMTVEQNIAYGGKARVEELLEAFAIAHLASDRPGRLSGGERQRVAIARALARDPAVLLLDEPLAALDPHTRARVRGELRSLLDELELPTILVSHDFHDAAALADRVGVILEGSIVQIGKAADLIAEPTSPFVAEFTGGNFLFGLARPGRDDLCEITLENGASVFSTERAEGPVGVVIDPWEVTLAPEVPADSTHNHIAASISTVVPVANRVRVRVGPLTAEVTPSSLERLGLRPGDAVVASFKATATRLIPLSRRGDAKASAASDP